MWSITAQVVEIFRQGGAWRETVALAIERTKEFETGLRVV
jgi:hypothetical protein